MPPVRALPVPFCRNILRVEPATSPRANVRTVPCRWFAWYITIACFSRFLRTSPPSFASSTLNVSIFLPAWLNTGTSIMAVLFVCLPPAAYRLLRRLHSGRDALPHEKQRSVRPRQRAFDQEQVVLRVDLHQRMIPRGHAVHPHVPGHAHALLGLAALTAPGRAGRDRAGRTMLALGAVGCRMTAEVMTLHHARGAFALAGADDVYELHAFENRDVHAVACLL